jgi:hypothetical protein
MSLRNRREKRKRQRARGVYKRAQHGVAAGERSIVNILGVLEGYWQNALPVAANVSVELRGNEAREVFVQRGGSVFRRRLLPLHAVLYTSSPRSCGMLLNLICASSLARIPP